MRSVAVVGDANVDIIVPYPRFLNPERTRVEYPTPQIQGGGTSANTAVALAKLDVPTSFIGTVGDDQYGRFIRNDLSEAGVDVAGVVSDPTLNTVGVFAFVDDRGERYLWGWPRVDQAFKILEETPACVEQVLSSQWVHSSGMSLTYATSARDTIIALFEKAHQAGIPTSFDLNCRSDDERLDPDFDQALRRIFPFTTYLLGSGPDEFIYLGDGSWKDNAAALATDTCTVIARDGCRGSFGFTAHMEAWAPAFQVDVVDTIGAGDVYNAGFIHAKLAGHDLSDSLRLAGAVAAYTVARKGSRNSPTSAQLAAFLAETPTLAALPAAETSYTEQ